MLEKNIREQIIRLIQQQVVPAVGCTEPMAVALCTARATELLGRRPEKITLQLSANILKNAMGVGIPGTGMIGLPIAVSLGALIGKSEYKLEVIKDLTPETLEEGKQYMAGDHISISLKMGISEKLYIEVDCEAGGHKLPPSFPAATRTSSSSGSTTRYCSTAMLPARRRNRHSSPS